MRAMAKCYGIGLTTVQKLRQRSSAVDVKMGPKEVRSTALTADKETIIVAFRRHTPLPLDHYLC